MAFQFKFDPSSLPKLASRGDNFTEWRSAWTLAFRYAGLWPLVSGKTPRPANPPSTKASSDAVDEWEEKDTKAMVMLVSSVHSDLTLMVTSAEDSARAWKYLAERFDRDTSNNSIHLFRSLTNLRYRDGEDLRNHLDDFHQLWTKMNKRCQASTQPVAIAMRSIFDSDEVKGSFFLTTLPETMEHIIDNLATRNVTSFTAIEPKILDIAEKHSLDTVDSSAYAATRNVTQKPTQRTQQQQSKGTDAPKECTWCRKHNLSFVGHVYTDCRRLQEHKAKNPSTKKTNTTAKPNTRSNVKANEANVVDISDDESTTINAFTASAILKSSTRKRKRNSGIIDAPDSDNLDDDQIVAYAVQSSLSLPTPPSSWLFDSGASRHMTGCVDDFSSLVAKTGTITIAGGQRLPIEGVGTVSLNCRLPDGSTQLTKLTNVLYSRGLNHTRLFSWTYVRHHGSTVTGKGDNLYLISPNGSYSLWAKFINGGMIIQTDDTITANFASYDEFHAAVGHLNIPDTNTSRLYKDSDAIPKKPTDFYCTSCKLSKSTASKPHPKPSNANSAKPFELIHSDVAGPFSKKSLGNSRYAVSLIDDHTRFAWVRFVERKSQVAGTVKTFLSYVQNQFDTIPKRFRSDNGGEYMAKELQDTFKQSGIVHEPTPPYSHESNGLAERFNRTVVTMARSMITTDGLLPLWAEAIHTATYLKNIAPHSALPTQMTPFEALFGRKPSVANLHPFGQTVYAHIHKEARQPGTKLLHRAETGIFVGYGKSSKIYRVYIPARSIIIETRHVEFRPFQQQTNPLFEIDTLDTDQPTPGTTAATSITADLIPATEVKPENSTQQTQHFLSSPHRPTVLPVPAAPSRPRTPTAQTQTPTITRAGRTTKPTPKVSGNSADAEIDTPDFDNLDSVQAFVASIITDDDVPNTIQEAQKSPEWPHWKKAISAELQSHQDNGTWTVVDLIHTTNVVGCRWIFAKKYDAEGNVRYKARLVAQGFSQRHGIDFDETYSPVVRYDSLRLLLRIASLNRLDIHQMDFDTAYLNSSLNSSTHIYMRCPPGHPQAGKVLKINKALYGLKQSGREWFGTLRRSLLAKGFSQTHFDPCVFRQEYLFIAIYVDDLLLVGQPTDVTEFKHWISTTFKCKDLGQARYLLGLEINVSQDGISLSQRAYAERVLARFQMSNCNSRKTPLDPNTFPQRSTQDEDPDPERTKLYQRLIGSLGYLVIGTRADLAFTTSMLGTFNSNPNELHLSLAKQTLRFVKATLHYALHFPYPPSKPRPNELSHATMFADASWGSDPDTAKSFSGYVFQLNAATVCWSAKRQSSVAKSTCEAEYMSCSHATAQFMWLKHALIELNVECHYTLCTDNEAAITLVKDQRMNARSKHIAIHYHFTRERYEAGDFDIVHVASKDNLADICTKALPLPLLQDLTQRLQLR